MSKVGYIFGGWNGLPETMPTEDVVVTGLYRKIYTVTLGELTNGTINVDKTSAEAGDTITVTVLPKEGYQLKVGSLKYNTNLISENTFTMPKSDVIITAEFEKGCSYLVTSGDKEVIKTDSTTDLKVTIDGDYKLFVKVLVDDKEIDPSNYTVKEGSTIITLLSNFLKTLSPGEHTMTTIYSNDKNVQATFNIQTNELKNPNTNDNINIYLLISAISLIGLTGTIVYKKRYN